MSSGKKSKEKSNVIIIFSGWLKNVVRCSNSIIQGVDSQGKKVRYPLDRRTSVKDVIESMGIPHTEIGELKNHFQRINFSHILHEGDYIFVFPHNVPVKRDNYLFVEPLKEIKFIVDVNVGKLAKFLRMLGYDCVFDWRWNDDEIAEIAYLEKRILLSRDIQLLKRKKILWGKLIQHSHPIEQLKEVVTFFNLDLDNHPFTRCIECNEKLVDVDKESIVHRLEPKTKKYFNEFSICPSCNRIYWQGSHVQNMKELIKKLKIMGEHYGIRNYSKRI